MAVTIAKNPNEDIPGAPHHFFGLASDTKPTVASPAAGLPVPTVGSTFTEYDTDIVSITYDGTNWVVRDLLVRLVAGSVAIGKLAANSGVDIGDVDVLSIAAGDNNIGNVDIASAIPAGTNAIGKLAANTGVDIGDVDILSIAAGDNNIGNVDIASAIPAGTNAIGKLAANTGVDIGDVDVLSIAAGTNLLGKVSIDQVTANANEVVLKAGTAAIGKLVANSGVDIGDVDVLSIAAGTNQIGARSKAGLSNSGVLSADTSVKGSAGDVYWITVSDTAALAIELNNSTGGTGTDLWGINMPANGYAHFIFDPPIEFSTGIYLDVSTATCKVTMGYK